MQRLTLQHQDVRLTGQDARAGGTRLLRQERRRRPVLRKRLGQNEFRQQVPSQPFVKQSRLRGLAIGVDCLESVAGQGHGAVILTGQIGRFRRASEQSDERESFGLLLRRDAGPQLDGALKVTVGLLKRPHLLGLQPGLHRRSERGRDLMRRRPMHGALRRSAVGANRQPWITLQRARQRRMQRHPLARQKLFIQGFTQKLMPERVALVGLVLHEHVVLDRLSQRSRQLIIGQTRRRHQ
jgi:hypothetical protein